MFLSVLCSGVFGIMVGFLFLCELIFFVLWIYVVLIYCAVSVIFFNMACVVCLSVSSEDIRFWSQVLIRHLLMF